MDNVNVDDARATLKTTILVALIGKMPPASFDYLERATDVAVEALFDPATAWTLPVVHDAAKQNA